MNLYMLQVLLLLRVNCGLYLMETAPCPDIESHRLFPGTTGINLTTTQTPNHFSLPSLHITFFSLYLSLPKVPSTFVSLPPTFIPFVSTSLLKPQFPVGSVNGLFSPLNFVDNEYVITIHFRHPISIFSQLPRLEQLTYF